MDWRSISIGVSMIGVALAIAFLINRASNAHTSPLDELRMPTATVAAPASAPPQQPSSGVAPLSQVVTPAPATARSSCDEIRGTDYRSDIERLWFAQNCQPAPPPTATPTPLPTIEGPVVLVSSQ
jgi:hypothetical protein